MGRKPIWFICCSAFIFLFSTNLYASGIAADATGSTCTNSVLETYDGDVNLQAAWEPNTIQIKWYNGDDEITPANSVATSCVYDDILTIPSNPPSKTGYTFIGWELRYKTCGINGLDTSTNGLGASYRGYTHLNGDAGENESNYGLTVGSGQWATEFSYGTVWGMANCNNTNGTANTAGTPTLANGGNYCWCQVTGFTASGNSYTSGPQCTTSASSSWVFYGDFSSADGCASGCAYNCAIHVRRGASFRGALFGVAGQ